jgi:aminopeptidase N
MRGFWSVAVATATVFPLGTAAPVQAAPAAAYDRAISTPREDPYYPAQGDPSVDALHYGLRLKWSATRRVLTGVARVDFRAPAAEDRVQLDLGDTLRVRSVRLDGVAKSFSHPGKDLVVETGPLDADSRHTLVISYRGTPRPVAVPTHRSDAGSVGWTTTKRGEVWTMQEPYGAYTWYPVNDHPSDKAFYDVRVVAPRGMVGVVNGSLRARRQLSGGRTLTRWDLASPAASYLTTIAIGDYVRYRDTGPHGLPITYWLPRRDRRALPELRRTPELIGWLEKRLGRYPFDRLGAVVVPSATAMETQTLVTVGRRLVSDRFVLRSVLLHEYAHQWYGDTVTPDSWPDLWLNESFAFYTELRWQVSRGWTTMADVRAFLEGKDADLRAEDGPPGAYFPDHFAEDCVYACGALMIDRLSQRLGPALFARVWREWPQSHRDASVDREDYIGWLNQRTGQDLRPFLTEWLTSPTTPTS